MKTCATPQRFDAYQRRVQPWKHPGNRECVLKERRISVDHARVRHSFRTRGRVGRCSQGGTFGWYAHARRGA